jgi:hypothetical protein
MERRNANVRGYTGKVVNYKGAVIREFVVGFAYPRNGNVHNATPERKWHVFMGGKLADTVPLLRTAKEIVNDAIGGAK